MKNFLPIENYDWYDIFREIGWLFKCTNVNIGIDVICPWLDSPVIDIKTHVLYVIIDFIFLGWSLMYCH